MSQADGNRHGRLLSWSAVGVLNPGSTAFFEVTIPNVQQTSDNIEVAVSFSGERYQYLGR